MMKHFIPADKNAEKPLINLLSAVSEELTELGQFTEKMQSVLGPALLRLADDPLVHRNVQMLDLLSQRLSVLSIFFQSLGQTVPRHWLVDSSRAMSAVTLSELAWRLQGHQSAQEQHPAGELESF